jgi:hypothetical protein
MGFQLSMTVYSLCEDADRLGGHEGMRITYSPQDGSCSDPSRSVVVHLLSSHLILYSTLFPQFVPQPSDRTSTLLLPRLCITTGQVYGQGLPLLLQLLPSVYAHARTAF